MPIFFERRQRGEDSVLSVYGTKEEFTQFSSDLKERLALYDLHRKPDSNLSVPNLKSSSFDEVEVLVLTAEETRKLKATDQRKKFFVFAIWLLIIVVIVALFQMGEKRG